MDAVDFRSIGRAAQEALRRRAMVLVEPNGMSQAEAARAVGVQRQTVNIWLKRYRERGEAGLLDGRRVSGGKGKEALRRCGQRLGLSTVQLYLKRWGMTPQPPLARATQRSPAAVAAWLARDYPAIAKRPAARKVKAWVQSHRHAIELFYLPAYATERNPDEYLNHDVKQKLPQQPQPDSKDELVANTRTVMRAIPRSPARVRGSFQPHSVQYARPDPASQAGDRQISAKLRRASAQSQTSLQARTRA